MPGREELEASIERAINRLNNEIAYENTGARLTDTLQRLSTIAEGAKMIAGALSGLSFLGRTAISDIAARGGESLNRDELDRVPRLAKGAMEARDLLLRLYSPIHERGQGAGSAMGRDSDRSVLAYYAIDTSLLPFRKAKDIFAISVMEALFKYDAAYLDRGSLRSAKRRLSATLDDAWALSGRNEPPSWEKVLRERFKIWDMIMREPEPGEGEQALSGPPDASSPETGR